MPRCRAAERRGMRKGKGSMASLGSSVGELDTALARLRQRWQTAHAVWDDAASRDFERTYWAEVEQRARETQRAMQALAEVVAQAQRAVH